MRRLMLLSPELIPRPSFDECKLTDPMEHSRCQAVPH
jgi:hypothetical protein